SGTITVTGAVRDGIRCNDYFIADGGTFDIKAGNGGIGTDEGHIIINRGDFTVEVMGDGISASYTKDSIGEGEVPGEEENPSESGDPSENEDSDIDPYVIINGGTFAINCSEGKGIASASTLTVNDADMTINSADDCINSADAIYINRGLLYCVSTNNDAMHSSGK